MKLPLLFLSAVLGAVSLNAQTTAVYSAVPSFCGRVSSPLICSGISLIAAGDSQPSGTAWVDVYTQGYNVGSGFLVVMGDTASSLSNFTQTKATVLDSHGSGRSIYATTSVSFDFSDVDTDGNSFTGHATLTFGGYYYSAGGGGRGGAGAGWRFSCTGGTITVTQ